MQNDMENVRLRDIEEVSKYELSAQKIEALLHGYDSFETQLRSRNSPIALDRSVYPYRIINGRHRIFVARAKGYDSVPVEFV